MKIGFVDYYISEWHANNYPDWIAQMSEKCGIDARVAYAWAEMDISPVDSVDTDTWCQKYNAERCSSIDELCQKSDAIVILAPSDPCKHLEYAKAVFKHKKPTYIDKTFAPNYDVAKEIFDEAQKYGVQFFSTSALRFADELEAANGAKRLDVTGSGSNIEEYIIHQIEMLVKVMGVGFEGVSYQKTGDLDVFEIKMSGSRSASLTFGQGLRFAYDAILENGESVSCVARSSYFKTLMLEMIKFFESGELPFDKEQTLEAMRIRDAILDLCK